MAEASSTAPPQAHLPHPITESDIIFDIDFHPTEPYIASALVTGAVNVYKYGPGEGSNQRLCAFKFHRESCRTLSFTPDAKYLYTGSADLSIRAVDCATARIAWVQERSHAAAVNCVKCHTEQMLSSGDDNGVVKVWDTRTNVAVMTFTENQDFISDMVLAPDGRMLIATSGDGHLAVYDTRKHVLEAMSDNLDDELLSAVIIKNGRKVVCGSQSGVLDIFSFGDWGDVTDRLLGHPQSVDTLVAIDDNVVCTGSSDGIIRVVSIHPNRILGVIGEHAEFPIEKLALSRDKQLLASSSHDHMIKFWDANVHQQHERMAAGEEEEEDSDEDDEEMEDGSGSGSDDDQQQNDDDLARVSNNLAQRNNNFYSDL